MSTADNNFNYDTLSQTANLMGRLVLSAIVGPFTAPAGKTYLYQDAASGKLKASENGGPPVSVLTGGGGGSAYQTIESSGTPLAQEQTMNFIPGAGVSLTIVDNPGSLRTDITVAATGSGGTVTSVAMTGDGTVFNSAVTGSPITTSGTLAPSLHTQSANSVLAGPTSGGAVVPTFRALVSGDVPAANLASGSNGGVTGTLPIGNGGTGQITANAALNALLPSQTANSGKFLTTDGTNSSWATVSGGGGTTATSAQVHNNANQGITASTWTTLGFNTTDYDTSSFHNNITNNSRLTVPATGRYHISAEMAISVNNCMNACRILKNGATVLRVCAIAMAADASTVNINIGGNFALASGDYVELQAFSDSVNPIAVQAGFGGGFGGGGTVFEIFQTA